MGFIEEEKDKLEEKKEEEEPEEEDEDESEDEEFSDKELQGDEWPEGLTPKKLLNKFFSMVNGAGIYVGKHPLSEDSCTHSDDLEIYPIQMFLDIYRRSSHKLYYNIDEEEGEVFLFFINWEGPEMPQPRFYKCRLIPKDLPGLKEYLEGSG